MGKLQETEPWQRTRRRTTLNSKLKRKTVRGGASTPSGRTLRAPGMGKGQGAASHRRVRRTRRRGQGRDHPRHHRARQPARVSRCRAARPLGSGKEPDVHAAVHAAFPGRRRDRDLRPQLVQPRRRRARDGLLHARSNIGGSSNVAPRSRSTSSTAASFFSSTGWKSATRNRSGGSWRASRTRCGNGNSARWTCRPARAGTNTPAPATQCSTPRTPSTRRGIFCAPTTRSGPGSTASPICLSQIPYKTITQEKIQLPKRSNKGAYDDQATIKDRRFVPETY